MDHLLTHLPNWLWPIACLTGLGAIIDFLLGRAGQQRARSWLETWWIRFDDVRLNNFGQKEALYAIEMIDRWCGRRFLSLRRLKAVITFYALAISISYILICIIKRNFESFTPDIFRLVQSLLSAIGLGMSISFTRYIASIIAKFCGSSVLKNSVLFISSVMLTYLLLIIWFPIIHALADYFNVVIDMTYINVFYRDLSVKFSLIDELINFIKIGIISGIKHFTLSPVKLAQRIYSHVARWGGGAIPAFWGPFPWFFANVCAGYVANLIRLTIGVIFVGSFLVRPVLMQPISLVWRRVVESEKPIFTMIFGGISGIGAIVDTLVAHL
jgi:hypothetical protein